MRYRYHQCVDCGFYAFVLNSKYLVVYRFMSVLARYHLHYPRPQTQGALAPLAVLWVVSSGDNGRVVHRYCKTSGALERQRVMHMLVLRQLKPYPPTPVTIPFARRNRLHCLQHPRWAMDLPISAVIYPEPSFRRPYPWSHRVGPRHIDTGRHAIVGLADWSNHSSTIVKPRPDHRKYKNFRERC